MTEARPKRTKRSATSEDAPGQRRLPFPAPLDASPPAASEDALRAIAASNLRGKYVGVTVSISRCSQQRQFEATDMNAVLQQFDADAKSVSAFTRLFDAKEEAVEGVNAVIAAINDAKTNPEWTLPHPRPGFRLLKAGQLEAFNAQLTALKSQLHAAAAVMASQMPELKQRAAKRLGKLYREANYAFDPRDSFDLVWRFHEIDVPSYLQHNKELFAAEQAKAAAELAEAVRMKEEEMAVQLYRSLDRLIERLEERQLLDNLHEVLRVQTHKDGAAVTYRPREGGEPQTITLTTSELESRVRTSRDKKTFRDETVRHIFSALDEADRQLAESGIGAGELRKAFDKLRKVVKHTKPDALPSSLRASESLRQDVAQRLHSVAGAVLDLSVLQPKRSVLILKSASSLNAKAS